MHTRKTYQHLFFDLDRTLWDFDANNRATFSDVFNEFKLVERGVHNPEAYFSAYSKINHSLWEQYKKQLITKELLNFRRFHDSLSVFGITDPQLAKDIASYYISASPLQTRLYPDTLKILDHLYKKYPMHIITNGFEEVQFVKIRKSGLEKYFASIITSEKAGFKKPDGRIFLYAFQKTGAKPSESILIGDDPEADIQGAQMAGMDQIWVKHPPVKPLLNGSPTFQVDAIKDILKILG